MFCKTRTKRAAYRKHETYHRRRAYFLEQLEPRLLLAVIDWAGDIPNGTVWGKEDVHRLTGDVRVPSGSTLTIESGTLVQANSLAGIELQVDGTLIADGSATAPIVFSSDRDDSGLDGVLGTADDVDTNDSPNEPSRGYWDGIRLTADSSGNLLDHVAIRYAGANIGGSLVSSGPATLSNVTVIESGSSGLRINSSNPSITNVTFRNNSGAAVSMDLASNPSIIGVTLENNGANALALDAGELVGDGFWDDPDIPYRLTGDVTVPAGSTLTVGAGQVVASRSLAGDEILVDGTLVADGTPSAPIIFTSERDPNLSIDIDNSGHSPNRGYWNGLQMNAGSSANVLDHVELRYAGANIGASLVSSGPATLSNVTIIESGSSGLRINSSNPSITNVTFRNNSGTAVSMNLASNPAIIGVMLENNGANALALDAGELVGDGFWDDPDIPYRLTGDVTVPAGATLTVGAGQVVAGRSLAGDEILVDGTLVANGSPAAPIIFTSERDPNLSIDIDNSGHSPGRGYWNGLQMNAGSSANVLNHVELRYAGANINASLVSSGPATLSNVTIIESSSAGLRINSSSPNISDVAFRNNGGAAISMDLASNPTITGVVLENNSANALALDAGILVGDGFWNDSDIPYRLSGDVTVPAGATLTVGAGQVVAGRSLAGDEILVDGTLLADGTLAAPIIFTSERDPNLSIDIDNSGHSPGRGYWNGLQMNAGSSANVLNHVELRYAGANIGASLVSSGPATLSNVTIIESGSSGLRINSSSPNISDVAFRNNGGAAISMDLASNPSITGVVLENNSANALALDAGTLVGDGFWDDPDIPYRLSGDVTVPTGAILTVGAGQVVAGRSLAGDQILVDGTLVADGTPAAPIIFTSERDPDLPINIDNSTNLPGRGYWDGVELRGPNNALDFVQFRFGVDNTLTLDGVTNTTITNSTVSNSSGDGVRVVSSNPILTNTKFENNTGAAVSVDLSSDPTIRGFVANRNGINGMLLDSGSVPANNVWNDPDIVFVIDSDVTVPEGVTLQIDPGVIIKATNSAADLQINGTLTVAGTVDQPVYVTSIRDDSIGGDTNSNANAPARGNWGRVNINASSFGSTIDHLHIAYGADATVNVVAGDIELRNSVIIQSSGDAVQVDGGSATLTNNVIANNGGDAVVAINAATITAVNNTIDGNRRGIHAVDSGTTVQSVNNLVTNNTDRGILITSGASFDGSFNDVFNPTGVNYDGVPDPTGIDGNISADPLYLHRVGANYQLREASPAVDAGTSLGAPAQDHRGNDRFDDPGIANLGNGTAPYFDLGAFERQSGSDPRNLKIVAVVTDITQANLGDPIKVQWEVVNDELLDLSDSWVDAVFASSDPSWDYDDTLLTTSLHTGGLSPGASYTAEAEINAPAVVGGKLYLIVRTDAHQQVRETIEADNEGYQAIDLEVTRLELNVPRQDQFTTRGDERYYRIDVTGGQTLRVELNSDATSGSTEMFVRHAQVPTRTVHDFKHNMHSSADQMLIVPTTRPGAYYLLARGRWGAAASSPFTVTATLSGDLELHEVSPSRAANAGQVTLELRGNHFTQASEVELVGSEGQRIIAHEVNLKDSTSLFAAFDFDGASIGAYRALIRDGERQAMLADAVQVIVGSQGALDVRVTTPSALRAGWEGLVTVNFTNTGDTDLIAPLIEIFADNASFRVPGDSAIAESTIQFAAVQRGTPASVLRPGESGSVPIEFIPNDGATQVNITTDVMSSIEHVIDWNAVETELRPSWVGNDAWNVIWTNFLDSVGTTVSQYQRVLAQNSTYLRGLGSDRIDLFQLLAFELQQAGLARIGQQFQLTAYGRGVRDPWEISLQVDGDTAAVVYSGSPRIMVRRGTGPFRGFGGDAGVLRPNGDGHALAEADGSVYHFDGVGRLTAVDDRNGNRVSLSYQNGMLDKIADDFGQTISLEYNSSGRVTRVVDDNGNDTRYTYDAAGEHVLSVAGADGTIAYTYYLGEGAAREHAVKTVRYPTGLEVAFTYDDQGRLTEQVATDGERYKYDYDDVGQITVTDSVGQVQTVSFNDIGQVARFRTFGGSEWDFAFDSTSRVAQVNGPLGFEVRFEHGTQGNLLQQTDALGHTVRMRYDSRFGLLSQLRDARGQATHYIYDDNGNLVEIIDAANESVELAYDQAGRLLESTNRRDQTIHRTYDNQGRLIAISEPGAGTTEYVYDDRGNLIRVTNSDGLTVIEYDGRDRPTRIEYPSGKFLRYTYDGFGQRTQMADDRGFAINYEYDTAGRMTTLRNAAGGLVVEYVYDSAGRKVRQNNGNGSYSSWSYNQAGYVELIEHFQPGGALRERISYEYDALDRRTVMTTSSGVTHYEYDATGQLTAVVVPDGSRTSYEYDAAGNRIAETNDGVRNDYVANRLNQYTSVGSKTYQYDRDGNLIEENDGGVVTKYRYDAQGRLIEMTSPGDVWRYEYDFLGHRTASVHNGQRTEWLIDPTEYGDVVAEYDAVGNLVAHYVHGTGLVARSDDVGAPGYYSYDAVGNTVDLTDSAGAVLNRYQYDPFGKVLLANETVSNPFQYVGHAGVMTESNGLQYMRARFSHAELGRFLQPDPIGIAGGYNLYTYSNNDPVSSSDPLGLDSDGIDGMTLAGAAATGADWVSTRTDIFHLEAKILGLTPEAYGRAIENGNVVPGRGYYQARWGHKAFQPRPGNTARLQSLNRARWANAGSTGLLLVPVVTSVAQSAGAIDEFDADTINITASGAATGLSIWSAITAAGAGVAGAPLFTIVGTGLFLWSAYSYYDKYWGSDPPSIGTCTGNPGEGEGTLLLSAGDEGESGASNPCHSNSTRVVVSRDPNDIIGPPGVGDENWMTPQTDLPYMIRFENQKSATAPAFDVFITNPIDEDFDLSTLELTGFGFGDQRVQIPPGQSSYSTTVQTTNPDGSPLLVRFVSDVDTEVRLLSFALQSLDPGTGLPPADPFAGFLPPNDDDGAGQGFITYRISPNSGLPTGTRLENDASIVFDTNEAIETNTALNTIDIGSPTSQVDALPETANPSFLVSWTGSDDENGSGIATYDIFVSDNDGPFVIWQDDIADKSATFDGVAEHTYRFYSVATDNVGHVEQKLAVSEASTTTLAGPPWQNLSNELDANGDTFVSAIDVLVIVNELNTPSIALASGLLPARTDQHEFFYDVNGDDFISAIDALIIINFLNDPPSGEGESKQPTRLILEQLETSTTSQQLRSYRSQQLDLQIREVLQTVDDYWRTQPSLAVANRVSPETIVSQADEEDQTPMLQALEEIADDVAHAWQW